MNERIKELAEQAWTMVSDEERSRNELYEADTQRERRDQVFAELIVRECAKISLECGINLNREDFRQGIARNIKQHFGVK